MKKNNNIPIPAVIALKKLGNDIKNARKIRRIKAETLSERAGIARATLHKIEKGDPTASMGSYVSVIFSLGMINNLKDLVDLSNDERARIAFGEALPKRIKTPKN